MNLFPPLSARYILLAVMLWQPAIAQMNPSTCDPADIDQDDDGLIEICDLDGLNAIRHQPDGSGYRKNARAEKITTGCDEDDSGKCIGYELARSLDFSDGDDYTIKKNKKNWHSGNEATWQPIGSVNIVEGKEIFNGFSGIFDGNGYTISNLVINMEHLKTPNNTSWGLSGVGLFGYTTHTSVIKNVGLLDLKIEKNNSPIAEPDNIPRYYLRGVGALVGINGGTVINSYAQRGTVNGGTFNENFPENNQQGRSKVGGLIGTNLNKIINSYSFVDVIGRRAVGGLVGENCYRAHAECPPDSMGEIINSYARGTVRGELNAGGLVGANRYKITNSYARGTIKQATDKDGGLVADNSNTDDAHPTIIDPPIITASYWRKNNKLLADIGFAGSAEAELSYTAGLSAADLKLPNDAIGIYEMWSTDNWDFGTSEQYPILKYTDGGAEGACTPNPNADIDSPRCGSLLPNQGSGLRSLNISPSVVWQPNFASQTKQYTLLIDKTVSELAMELKAYNDDAAITLKKQGNEISANNPIQLESDATSLTVRVVDAADTIRYTFVVKKVDIAVADEITIKPTNGVKINADGTVEVSERDEITLSVISGGIYRYVWMQTPPPQEPTQLLGQLISSSSITIRIPPDFVEAQAATQSIVFTVTVHNDNPPITTSLSKTLIVKKNERPTVAQYIADIDIDDDGLIEIYYLEDLNNIRHQLDGSGYREQSGDKITNGCPQAGCKGYELARNLDFGDLNSYRNATNQSKWWLPDLRWEPIGNSSSKPFKSTFEGNGRTISNLIISQPNIGISTQWLGLFGYTEGTFHNRAKITNVGLLDINIFGISGKIGGLVGQSYFSSITNSYVTGNVAGNNQVGGLVGFNDQQGIIHNCYVRGKISGNSQIGGLAGYNHYGSITNSYAAGSVTGKESIGGLVGTSHVGKIENSLARVQVIRERIGGGLVGKRTVGIDNKITTIKASYWQKGADSTLGSIGGVNNEAILFYKAPRTENELKSPIAPVAKNSTATYAGWQRDDWDFGTSRQYPILKYTDREEGDACGENIPSRGTDLPQCASLLPKQGTGLRDLNVFPQERTVWEDFSSDTTDYDLGVHAGLRTIYLELKTYNPDALITIDGVGTAIASTTTKISLVELPTILTIVVAETNSVSTTYNITVNSPTPVISGIRVEPANEDGTVNEGDIITLVPSVFGGIRPYRYQWMQIPSDALMLSEQNTTSLRFQIPSDFIDSVMTRALAFKVIVSDSHGSSTSRSQVLTIRRIDNGPPNLTVEASATTLTASVVKDSDPDGNGDTTYQWQRRVLNNQQWEDIDAANAAAYKVPDNTPGSIRHRLLATHRDAQGHTTTTQVGPFRTTANDDEDNLIEIYYLEDLHAIRYQLDGTGYSTTNSSKIKITAGCDKNGNEKCLGYELARDLNFSELEHYLDITNKTKWYDEKKWPPIGLGHGSFSSLFEGNDYTISNLSMANNQVFQGLFIHLSTATEVRNLGLLDIDIEGNSIIGGLAVINTGLIVNSHVSGQISGHSQIGGLVGINQKDARIINSFTNIDITTTDNSDEPQISYVGGLVGLNSAQIANSYATGDTTGNRNVGGLVGLNSAQIVNSYATGNAIGNGNKNQNIGGLVGMIEGTGSIKNTYANGDVSGNAKLGGLVGLIQAEGDYEIKNSYATSLVSGSTDRGGLIGAITGDKSLITITRSYWDTDTSGLRHSAGGAGKTSRQLKSPTDVTGIYRGWRVNNWNFGTSTQYPILKYGTGFGSSVACNTDSSTDLPNCDSFLGEQQPALASLKVEASNDGITFSEVALPFIFEPETLNYGVELAAGATAIKLTPSISDDSTIKYKINDNALKNLVAGASIEHTLSANNIIIVIRVIPQKSKASSKRAAQYSIELNRLQTTPIEPNEGQIFIDIKVLLEGTLR